MPRHFLNFGEPAPGAGIDYDRPLATVPAYPGDVGRGGAGRAASAYSWTSEPLYRGTWDYSIDPVSKGGEHGTETILTVTVGGPPHPTAPFSDGARLQLSYNPTGRVATLDWNASPDA